MQPSWIQLWLPFLVFGAFSGTALVALAFKKRLLAACLFGFGALVFIGLFASSFLSARSTACKNSCIANLKQLDGLKTEWATAKKAATSVTPQRSDLAPYLNKHGHWPVCPADGTYTLGAVNEPPRCSLHARGHTLPLPR
jgi:hypothetical protein